MAVERELRLLMLLVLSSFYACHYLPEPEDIIQGVVIEDTHSLKRRSVEQSLRVKFIVQSPSMTNISDGKKSLIINKLLPEAVAYFGRTFKVRQTTLPITLQRKCKNGSSVMKQINGDSLRFCIGECEHETRCGPVPVPSTHLDVCRTCDAVGTNCVNKTTKSNGVSDADFVLYASAVSTTHCTLQSDVIAYAGVCQQEHFLDRPVAGFVNFCEKKLSSGVHYSHLLAIVKHELYHALGFSSSLYGYYRADDGTPLTARTPAGKPIEKWSNKVVRQVVRDHWHVSDTAGSSILHKVELIVTPSVLREVRAHFNCPTLEGAEIENQGERGQKQTHWEKRLFENEAMTGVFTHNPVFSRITLALMEDTGWYKANYEMAEKLEWGQNAGCLFTQNSCKAWMDDKVKNNKSVLPYCMQVAPKTHTQTDCTLGYDSVGTCNLVEYNTLLPVDYRYFNSLPGVSNPGYYAGAIAFADYCPFIQELDWKKNGKTIRGSNCKHVTNNLDFEHNYALEEYGASSACFLHGKKWTRKSCSQTVTSVDWGSGCYLYKCSELGIVLSIMGHSYPCWLSGENIEIKLVDKMSWFHEGSLVCPPCHDLCHDSCPIVQIKQLYNSTSNKHLSQKVLVCNSSRTRPSFRIIVFSFFIFSLTFFREGLSFCKVPCV